MRQECYKEVLEPLTDGVYFVDTDRQATYWNKAAERLSGYASEEVMGRSCADNILRHLDEEGCQLCLMGCPLSETMKDGEIRETSIFMHHKFGHRVPVFVRASLMRSRVQITKSAQHHATPALRDFVPVPAPLPAVRSGTANKRFPPSTG